MSWTRSWYLERRIGGVWHRDERPWHPSHQPWIQASTVDRPDEAYWFLHAIERVLSSLATDHLPHDLSVELDTKLTAFVDHVAEEMLVFPSFGWLLFHDILQADWRSVTEQDAQKRDSVDQWLRDLASLGNPRELRLVFMLSG